MEWLEDKQGRQGGDGKSGWLAKARSLGSLVLQVVMFDLGSKDRGLLGKISRKRLSSDIYFRKLLLDAGWKMGVRGARVEAGRLAFVQARDDKSSFGAGC